MSTAPQPLSAANEESAAGVEIRRRHKSPVEVAA
jgi:hypothetical protein